MNIKQVPAHTNNYTVGREGKKIKYIIMHWIVGNLASCDATFKNASRQASAHYGIEDSTIHQYVQDQNTAWHAGNWNTNTESIGIEHSGGELLADKKTRRKPSEETHRTSALLIKELCKKYNIPLDRKYILKHNEVGGANTQCCGTLDIDYIIELAKGEDTPITPEEPQVDPKIVLKKKLNNELWHALKEFEHLRQLKLIDREDSIQTQTQKWVKIHIEQDTKIKDLENKHTADKSEIKRLYDENKDLFTQYEQSTVLYKALGDRYANLKSEMKFLEKNHELAGKTIIEATKEVERLTRIVEEYEKSIPKIPTMNYIISQVLIYVQNKIKNVK